MTNRDLDLFKKKAYAEIKELAQDDRERLAMEHGALVLADIIELNI